MVVAMLLSVGTGTFEANVKAEAITSTTDSAVTGTNMSAEDIINYIGDCTRQGKYKISFASDMEYDDVENAINKGITSPWNIADKSSISCDNGIYTLDLYSDDYTLAQLQSMSKALTKEVDKIIKKVIKPNMVDYEKEVVIHDYINAHAVRDVAYDNYADEIIMPIESKAYEVLVKGVGVSEGYAAAMQLLLTEVGIPCSCISGVTNISEQTWDLVTIDGKNYHVDIFGDDFENSDFLDKTFPRPSVARHAFFNLTDKEISESHNWDTDKYITNCNSKAAEYICTVKTYKDFVALYTWYASCENTNFKIGVYNYDSKKFSLKACIKDASKDLPFWEEAKKSKFTTSTIGGITVLNIKVTYKSQWS